MVARKAHHRVYSHLWLKLVAEFWFSIQILQMEASSEERWSGLKDADMYNKLIKLHLPTEPKHCSLYWSTSDMEVIVGHFTCFLCAIASTGYKIDKVVLTKELQKLFSSSQQECKDFAAKLADALSYCRFCRKSLRSGSKTSAPVLRVINAMNIDKLSLIHISEPTRPY